ncbi:MAG: right-handed parallel beta-helix repeat-containing protein [Acidimicrobiia bacterium]|nr:right-handed parallel beta-helix repeat-containing protein [Acidimicrobiia bacterium]
MKPSPGLLALRRDLAIPLAILGATILVVAVVAWQSGADAGPADAAPPGTVPDERGSTQSEGSTTTLAPLVASGPPTLVVTPDDDLSSLVATSPPGSTFVLAPGVHRGELLEPRDGQVFTGRPGAVLSGAVVVTGFQARGAMWVAQGLEAEGRIHGQCSGDSPRCSYPEDLFIDDQLLTHVDSAARVGPGSWHFDRGADTIYLGENPTGRIVELSVVTHAFRGDADGVTIADLVIEKYAVPAQEGAIDSRRDTNDLIGGSGWVIRDNVVRWNHGVGIAATTGALVEGNQVYENGQLGMAAKGAGVTIVGNEVYGNNTVGFSTGWEAGGSKFAFTQGLVVQDNFIHDNDGPGLWTDIDNIDTTYEGNRVIDNTGAGIYHEISYDAVITGNEVRGNGFGFDAWVWGAGILVSTSVNVEVTDNLVSGNADGIVGVDQDRSDAPASYGALSLQNLSVSNNVIADNGGWSGIGQDRGDNAAFNSANNRFFDNSYTQDGRHFFWLNDPRTYDEWVAYGQG